MVGAYNSKSGLTRTGFRGVMTAAALLCAFGLLMMASWHLHLVRLIQWHPDYAPIQYNAAFGLLTSAMGLMALTAGARRIAALCGALGVLLATLTLLQYAFGLALGVDTLFINSYLTVHTSTPGRMAPNAAVCLALAGLALLCLAGRRPAASAVAGVAAVLCGAVAALAVAGYAGKVTMAYGWFGFTHMALPAALAFLPLSWALLMHCAQRWETHPRLRLVWRPLLVAGAMSAMTCAMWLSLLDAERAQLQRNGKDELVKLISRVTAPVESRIAALGQMKRRWEFRGATPRAEWEADAAVLQESPGYFRAIEWVDPERVVRWVVPLKGNEAARDMDLGAELNGLAALEVARFKRSLSVTHVVTLAQGGEGFMAIQPLFAGPRLDGFIVGVFEVQPMLARAIGQGEFANGYAVQVFDGERKLFGQHDAVLPAADLIHEGTVQFHDVRWQVRMWPTEALVARQSSSLPWTVLGTGLFVALLLGLIMFLIRVANERAQELRTEIGERIRAEQENALLISELEVVFANVIVGIALIKNGRTVRCNTQYADILGYQIEQVAGQSVAPQHPSEVVAREMGEAVAAALRAGQSFTVDLELVRHDGTRFWAACFGKALDPDNIDKGTVWVLEDISARKQAEEQLIYLAQHDALTGLANRTMLGDRLNMAVNRAARHQDQMAVCYIDLDRFKYINDTFGHDIGDQLLLAVSQRLLGSVRDTDTVARLGGDEFALVLSEGVDPEVVATVLQRIIDNICAPLELGGHPITVSGSIGVAIYPQHGLDSQTLLKHADEAMYDAKQAGRNNWRAYAPPVAQVA
ncbi:diguanylate cyclase [Massilia sp. PAMC28688]|uniref:sensor domain-containing diguanylate cyclase n=1 Tax=Massilia sp. PAMC28688 TaxID=2861283 RepID=UPI001C62F8BA|nr:diguanylate cyclase [Massilia sp. PAMC28688]QYF92589.1 diguanylate cyclase [Massilia sp. PAMC28688]